ncbi:hypothetical protein RRG08_008452 [Elysia crispata]|uniref:Uncharacterized protein n=1 Tax=Elysia crispata TaxID=231223 RepID=A0AAE1B2H4_9GAST|nr:hypothetical protein RRG08_008452 [Elysia crispata]
MVPCTDFLTPRWLIAKMVRFRKAAEDLVYLARGENAGRGWKMADGREASFDDISVFVIPLHQCLSANRKKNPKLSGPVAR